MAPEISDQPKILQFRLRRLLASFTLFSIALARFRYLFFRSADSPNEYGEYEVLFCAGLFGAGVGALFRGGLGWGFLVGLLAPIGLLILVSLFDSESWSVLDEPGLGKFLVFVLGLAGSLLGSQWLSRSDMRERGGRRRYLLWALVLLPLSLPAYVVTGIVSEHVERNRPRVQYRLEIASNQNIKHLSLAIHAYLHDHGEWPERLDDVQPFVGKPGSDRRTVIIGQGKDFGALLKNPFTGDEPGYEYVKPPNEFEDGMNPVILYSLREGKRDLNAGTAYANGTLYRGRPNRGDWEIPEN